MSLLFPFVSLSPFCLLLSPFLSPFLLVTVSALSPFCFPSCLPSCCAVPTSALQTFPFVSQLCTAVLQSLTCLPAPDCCVRLSLAILDICLPALGCCVRLSLATLHNCLPVLGCCVFLSLAILYICLSAPCCVRLGCCVRLAILYVCLPTVDCALSLSLATLHICLPALVCSARNPVHAALAILCLPALDVASSSCRVFKLFGDYGGVISIHLYLFPCIPQTVWHTGASYGRC